MAPNLTPIPEGTKYGTTCCTERTWKTLYTPAAPLPFGPVAAPAAVDMRTFSWLKYIAGMCFIAFTVNVLANVRFSLVKHGAGYVLPILGDSEVTFTNLAPETYSLLFNWDMMGNGNYVLLQTTGGTLETLIDSGQIAGIPVGKWPMMHIRHYVDVGTITLTDFMLTLQG